MANEMERKIVYQGIVQNLVGKQEEQLSIGESTTVHQLLLSLTERYGDSFRASIVDAKGGLRSTTRIFLDGHDVNSSAGLETKLGQSKEISLKVIINPIIGR